MVKAGSLGAPRYCPHTVTVYNRATIKVLIYLYYEYYPTVTEWGQYPTYVQTIRTLNYSTLIRAPLEAFKEPVKATKSHDP